MWILELDADYGKKQKKLMKKHRREVKQMLKHFDFFHYSLNQGMSLEQAFCLGFVHVEPKGIIAIDQKGAGAGTRQTRLYVYPDATTKILHLITIGTKEKHSQKADIQYASEFVDSLRQVQDERCEKTEEIEK